MRHLPTRPGHEPSIRSLIRISCICGKLDFHNHELKGKSDEDLVHQIKEAWAEHMAMVEVAEGPA